MSRRTITDSAFIATASRSFINGARLERAFIVGPYTEALQRQTMPPSTKEERHA